MPYRLTFRTLLLWCALPLTGCSTWPAWLPTSGPSRQEVEEHQQKAGLPGVRLVAVTDEITRQLTVSRKQLSFADAFGMGVGYEPVIGKGDVIEVSVWEAPPAMLFGNQMTVDPRFGPANAGMVNFPEQMVNSKGTITLPFTGAVQAAGRCAAEIEADIAVRLEGKANQPQVLVRTIRNNTANVTVVGDVVTSTRMPLTAKGERLLDALAAGGGVKQSVDRTTVQVSRGTQVRGLPLEKIIQDPQQNIFMQAGDVVTALFQPLSFTMLGAAGKSEEINFEAQGLSLAQALARAGGMNDSRADAKGLFVFRYEDPAALNWAEAPSVNAEGKVPVIYQIDLHDPTAFFIAQNFPIANSDVLYVANSPAAELQKFVNIVVGAFYPAMTVVNATR